MNWPKKPYKWIENNTCFISVPFTWCLPEVKQFVNNEDMFIKRYVIGGPAIDLIPDFIKESKRIKVGGKLNGVLQKINPEATRTTVGCIRHCKFCGIGINKIEADGFKELSDWPDLPILTDNNLLASSRQHFDKVIDRLLKWGWCDFNQGLDIRLLNKYHAERIAVIKKPHCRLAYDNKREKEKFIKAYSLLRNAKIANKNISSYVLIGFDSDPQDAWERCEWIETFGIKAYPMWYHSLTALKLNEITEKQKRLGWTNRDRLNIMGYYYKHRQEKGRGYISRAKKEEVENIQNSVQHQQVSIDRAN